MSKAARGTEDGAPLTAEEIRSKLCEYTAFVDGTLRPDLEAAVKDREGVESEIAEYEDLSSQLGMLRKRTAGDEPLESTVDLGHRVAFCRAEVEDPGTVFVHLGLGFHVEMTLDEAIRAVGERIKFLQDGPLRLRDDRAKNVAGNIEGAISIMEELNKKSLELSE
mmetsp:Transcript_10158/g.30037  ORF Transcript_10158/g.30037 Transcript_10158/m.30037 type:complete len:165 (-) Transcript_10158:78-572(-)